MDQTLNIGWIALSVAVIPGCEYCVAGWWVGWVVVGAGISYGWMVEPLLRLYPSTLGQSLQHICSWLTVFVDRCKRLSGYNNGHDWHSLQAYKGDIKVSWMLQQTCSKLPALVDRCLTDVRTKLIHIRGWVLVIKGVGRACAVCPFLTNNNDHVSP